MNQQKLDALGVDLHSFLLKYQEGQRTVAGLISTELLRTRHQIAFEVESLRSDENLNKAEIQNSTKDIKQHVRKTVSESMASTIATFSKDFSDLRLEEELQKHRDRLLGSLKYPGMNERRQQITGSFPKTFGWVFGDDTLGEDEQDEEIGSSDSSATSSNPDINEPDTLKSYKFTTDNGN